MTRKTLAPIAIALLTCLASLAAHAAGQGPTFRFNPPDGITRTETMKTTQVLDLGGGRTTTRNTVTKSRVAVRNAKSGHTVAATLLSGKTVSGRTRQDDISLEALQGLTITYTIDAAGRMVGASGLDAVVNRFRRMFPPEVLANMPELTDTKWVLAAEQAEWNRSVVNYKGRPAILGTAWLATEEYALQNETLTFYAAMKVVGEKTIAGRKCLQVRYQYSQDPSKLAGFLGEAAKVLLPGKTPFVSDSTISGGGERLVDPLTLLPYGGTLKRTINTVMTVPGQGNVPVIIHQTKTYTEAYARAK